MLTTEIQSGWIWGCTAMVLHSWVSMWAPLFRGWQLLLLHSRLLELPIGVKQVVVQKNKSFSNLHNNIKHVVWIKNTQEVFSQTWLQLNGRASFFLCTVQVLLLLLCCFVFVCLPFSVSYSFGLIFFFLTACLAEWMLLDILLFVWRN